VTPLMLLSGNANRTLAEQIAQHLKHPLGKSLVGQFSDGESRIEISEDIQGRDVFILQPTSTPTNHHLMELLLIADAMRRAAATRITAVIPYFGYARQDRRLPSTAVPISAKVCADLLTSVGVDRILTLDLHAEQLQGFFAKPVENLYSAPVFLKDVLAQKHPHPMIVSPDIGGVVRARIFAQQLNDAALAIIDKRRPEPNKAEVMNIIGNVKDRHCVIIDDMVDTANTVCQAAMALKEHGAKTVVAYVTHPVLSGTAVQNIMASPLDELVVTDTIPLSAAAQTCKRIRVLSVAPLLAKAIQQVHQYV